MSEGNGKDSQGRTGNTEKRGDNVSEDTRPPLPFLCLLSLSLACIITQPLAVPTHGSSSIASLRWVTRQ